MGTSCFVAVRTTVMQYQYVAQIVAVVGAIFLAVPIVLAVLMIKSMGKILPC